MRARPVLNALTPTQRRTFTARFNTLVAQGLAANPDPANGRKRDYLERRSYNLAVVFHTHRNSILTDAIIDGLPHVNLGLGEDVTGHVTALYPCADMVVQPELDGLLKIAPKTSRSSTIEQIVFELRSGFTIGSPAASHFCANGDAAPKGLLGVRLQVDERKPLQIVLREVAEGSERELGVVLDELSIDLQTIAPVDGARDQASLDALATELVVTGDSLAVIQGD